jgi:hypothetical protein
MALLLPQVRRRLLLQYVQSVDASVMDTFVKRAPSQVQARLCSPACAVTVARGAFAVGTSASSDTSVQKDSHADAAAWVNPPCGSVTTASSAPLMKDSVRSSVAFLLLIWRVLVLFLDAGDPSTQLSLRCLRAARRRNDVSTQASEGFCARVVCARVSG